MSDSDIQTFDLDNHQDWKAAYDRDGVTRINGEAIGDGQPGSGCFVSNRLVEALRHDAALGGQCRKH